MARTSQQGRGMVHGLGMIPTFQFSNNPAINPGINPYINRSPQWHQQGLNGSAGPRATIIGHLGSDAIDIDRSSANATQVSTLLGRSGLGLVMVDAGRSYRPALNGVTDIFRAGGWVYANRKPLLWGGIGLAAVGVGLAFLR